MHNRRLATADVSAIGLGCMSLSHAYGEPPEEAHSIRLLNQALDLGITHFDTAALYGFGHNETLVGKALGHRRDEFFLASKCGIDKNAEGKREIDNRPERLRQTLDDSLARLGVDHIDLYYLHRWDKKTPIEDSVGFLSDMVKAGKIGAIGLSEVSADTLRKAHAVHSIAAVQTEYSLWTRNAEIAVLDACKQLGAAFVAFSPLARAFLTGRLTDPSALHEKDLRRNMPRFNGDNYPANLDLLGDYRRIAEAQGCTMGQLALTWLLARGGHVLPIPGTTNPEHLVENAGAGDIVLDPETVQKLDELINQTTVHGPRYGEKTQLEIDTEEFSEAA